jgi:general secretion pathway protein G
MEKQNMLCRLARRLAYYLKGQGRKCRCKEDSQRGFTLLGVLIAVLIMGTMATVAIPKFTSALAAANTAKIQADLATIDTAIALYKIDKGTSPTDMANLQDYLENYEQVKPPTGECNIKGKRETISDVEYKIAAPKDGRAHAELDSHPVYDFGGKE